MPPVPRLQLSDRAERRREAARRRRRRGHVRLGILIVVVIVLALILSSVAGGSANRRASGTRRASAIRRASARGGTGTPGRRGATAGGPANPLTTRRVTTLLAGRHGQVSAAVEDLTTGTEWVLKPNTRDQTASIVKVNILAALLYQAQKSHTQLSAADAETAAGMIEDSDNDDASSLWQLIGGNAGLDDFDDMIGMNQTEGAPDGFWGETQTSAADQIKLLRQLALPDGVLDAAAVRYELSLMENIDPGENWGITAGVPTSGVTVALKNGWVPLTSNTDWEVNSIGWVDGDHHDYLIAVLTAHDPSEDYGIDTIDALSKDIYDTLGPRPPAGTATIQVTPTG